MNPILHFDHFLNDQKLQEFKNLIGFDIIQNKYETSHFFNKGDNSIVVDKHIRSSEKIQFRTDVIFDWYETNIIQPLNDVQNNMHYVLLRDDIEMIRYREGDFFKKHVDTINFYSNEFTSYTCILNVQPCEQGGETIICDTGDIEYKYSHSNSPGSLLLFQKQLEHEGAVVEKGEKIITVCNIMVFPKEKFDDVLIVTIEKSNNTRGPSESKDSGLTYFIPISILQNYKHTVYYAFYHFEKTKNINQNIFRYTESFLNDSEFRVFYDILFPNKHKKNLDVLDYIGVDKSQIYSDFSDFVNDIHSDSHDKQTCISDGLFFCHMDDYYSLNKLIDPASITPFQLITFEYNNKSEDFYYGGKKKQIVTWFGLHDNLFVTCDYIANKKDNLTYVTDDPHLQRIDSDYIDKLKNLYIPGANVFDIYGGIPVLSKENKTRLNKLLYTFNKFKKMSDITFSKSNDPYVCMNKYIVELMKSIEIEHSGDGYNNKNSSIIHNLLDSTYKLFDYEKIIADIDFDVNRLDVYDWTHFMNSLLKTSLISDIKRSYTSAELTCNSTQYTIYDVVFRFGFVKNNKLKKNSDSLDTSIMIDDFIQSNNNSIKTYGSDLDLDSDSDKHILIRANNKKPTRIYVSDSDSGSDLDSDSDSDS